MTEGTEDASAGPPPTPAPASPAGTGDPGLVPKEKPQEVEPVAEAREEGSAAAAQGAPGGAPEGGASPAGERPPGVVALPAPCCVCVDVEQVDGCLQSEKICILPILACLLSLALCTAGLKWVFVDKIFQHQPPTHPKPMGQGPSLMAAEPSLGLTTPPPYSSPSSGTTSAVLVEQPSTGRPPVLQTGRAAPPDPDVPAYSSAAPSVSKQAPPLTTAAWELVATLSTTTAKTSSHVTPCSDSQRNYCVNGGECFTLEIMPGSTKFLCRCPNEFTGDRCQNYVMASFYKAEELYQKRVLTIAGICIALLVVGVVCVVAYCRTKTQRRKLHQHLRQSLRNQRKAAGALATKPQGGGAARGHAPTLPLRDLQRMNRGSGTPERADEKEAETSFSTAKYAFSGPEATTATRLSSQRSTWPPASASPRLERTSQTMSATSITFSLSAEDDCLLLPSTPPQPWGPAERRRRSAHGQRSALADEGPAGPGLPPEKVEQRVSSPASSAASETSLSSGGGSKQASPEAEVDADRLEEPRAETRPFFSAAGASRLLPGPWYSSSSTAAPPSSRRPRPCQPVAPEHHLLAV